MITFLNHSIFNHVILIRPQDIVQYSFIVQNSISPLNLELTQSHEHGRRLYISPLSNPKVTLNTEEQIRKRHSNRDTLYRLHLDIPKAKECSFKFDFNNINSEEDRQWRRKPSLTSEIKINIDRFYYIEYLYRVVVEACDRVVDKKRILKWFINFGAFQAEDFIQIPPHIISRYVECLFSDLADTEFVTKCLMKLNFGSWISDSKEAKLESLLYLAHRAGRNAEIMYSLENFINNRLLTFPYSDMEVVLKFFDKPRFSEDMIDTTNLADTWGLEDMFYFFMLYSGSGSKKRNFMLIHLLCLYSLLHEAPTNIPTSIRLMWESMPDPYLTIEEMRTLYTNFPIGSELIEQLYDFYCESVDNRDSTVKPRTLQHYCRCTIRKVLCENNQWLPEAIGQMKLPKKLKSYLNLDMSLVSNYWIDFSEQ